MDLRLLSQISYFDLYFFSELATPFLTESRHGEVLHSAMRARFGEQWREKWIALDARYSVAVKALIVEQTESRQRAVVLERMQNRTPSWRRSLISYASLAESKVEKKSLKEAAGYGLGSPLSLKEQKDFWLVVSAKIKIERSRFLALGVPPALLEVAQSAHEELSSLAAEVAKERAEDDAAMLDVRLMRTSLVEVFTVVHYAIKGVYEGALVLGQDGLAKAAQDLKIRVDTSFDQARVRTQKRVGGRPLPLASRA